MNVKERLAMIDKKVANDKKVAVEKVKTEESRRKYCLQKIKDLTERISDVLEVANYAIQNGISLSNSGFGGHEGYDTGMFVSNGWSHLVGIMDKTHLGIRKGGACGSINFMTNGQETYGYDTRNEKIVEPQLNDMECFLRMFDEFESELYKFIEKKCSQ